jgi:hypothetical protein
VTEAIVMPEGKRRIRRLRESSATLTSAAGSRRVPGDLLRQASRRLQVMALMAGVLWVVGPVLRHLALHVMHPGDTRWNAFLPFDWVAAASCAVSLSLYGYLRSRDREPLMVMDLGLAFMVATAFALGVLVHWGSLFGNTTGVAPMITFIGPFMLMFAAIVPVSPWKLLAAGFVAASMDPLGMVIWKAAGVYQFGSMSDLLLMHYPNFLMLGMAVVISRVVTGLGQQVSREREMGSYRLGDLLGSGGMGDVYQADPSRGARRLRRFGRAARDDAVQARGGGRGPAALAPHRRAVRLRRDRGRHTLHGDGAARRHDAAGAGARPRPPVGCARRPRPAAGV